MGAETGAGVTGLLGALVAQLIASPKRWTLENKPPLKHGQRVTEAFRRRAVTRLLAEAPMTIRQMASRERATYDAIDSVVRAMMDSGDVRRKKAARPAVYELTPQGQASPDLQQRESV